MRNRKLGNLVAAEVAEESRSRVDRAEAALADANVAIDTAKLNLQRATIVSPVDGYLNDRAPRAGEFVAADARCCRWWTCTRSASTAISEETKLFGGIRIGQPVDISVMGEPQVLRGHVQSIVAGIEDRDRTQGTNLLPNVNPAFGWVRLAQRVPVRVALDEVPPDFPHDRRAHRYRIGARAGGGARRVPRRRRRRRVSPQPSLRLPRRLRAPRNESVPLRAVSAPAFARVRAGSASPRCSTAA